MHDQVIEVHRALHRNEVENKKNLMGKKIKDSRNLYLVKEGGNYYYEKLHSYIII